MTRRRWWRWAIGGAALVLVVLAAAALTALRPERLKAIALSEVRRTTGLTVDAGPASVRLGFTGVGLRVHDLRVAVADSSQILRVERADATFKLRPLLRRQVELRGLVLHRPDLQVRAPAPRRPGARPLESSPFLSILFVESWSVKDGSYGQNGPDGDFALSGVDLSGGFLWRAKEGATGSIHGRASGGSWKVPALSAPLPSLDVLIDFHLNAAGDSLTVPRLEVSSGALKLALSGAFHPAGRAWVGALTGRSDPFTWDEARRFIPSAMVAKLDGVSVSGRFEIPDLRVAGGVGREIVALGRLRFSDLSVQAVGGPPAVSEGEGDVSFVHGPAQYCTALRPPDPDGLFLTGLKASFYGGRLVGEAAVTPVEGDSGYAQWGRLTLTGVDLGGALAEWFPIGRRLEGSGRADLAWTGRAAPGLDLLRALDLRGTFAVEDGAVLDVSGLADVAQALQIAGATARRWPFRRLTAALALREGRVAVDSLRVVQDGLGWSLSGSVGLNGNLALNGLLRADPKRVSLPSELALFAPHLAEKDGRIPIDFQLRGTFADPSVVLDWKALGRRAAAKARGG